MFEHLSPVPRRKHESHTKQANAVRAYFEWMPIRQVEMDDNLRIWRDFSFGDLFDLIMLDTRLYDRSITDLYTVSHQPQNPFHT